MATDTPEGLIVPVVKDVDQKTLLTLATDLARLTDLAASLVAVLFGSCVYPVLRKHSPPDSRAQSIRGWRDRKNGR